MRTALLLTVVLAAGCASRQLPAEKSLSGQTTLLGCLQSGPGPADYFLAERGGQARVQLVGSADLQEQFGGRAVRVIGMLNRETNAAAMKVIRIEHLAVSCQTPF